MCRGLVLNLQISRARSKSPRRNYGSCEETTGGWLRGSGRPQQREGGSLPVEGRLSAWLAPSRRHALSRGENAVLAPVAGPGCISGRPPCAAQGCLGSTSLRTDDEGVFSGSIIRMPRSPRASSAADSQHANRTAGASGGRGGPAGRQSRRVVPAPLYIRRFPALARRGA